jgi:hypothetical protein
MPRRGRGGPPQFPCPPSAHPTLPTPRSSSAPAVPGLQRLPWPSPWIQRLGTPLSPFRVSVTRLQDSLDAAGWTVAPPEGAFDAGLRRRAFPPDAASLLPGLLAATRTGLAPAGEHELVRGSPHRLTSFGLPLVPHAAGHTKLPLAQLVVTSSEPPLDGLVGHLLAVANNRHDVLDEFNTGEIRDASGVVTSPLKARDTDHRLIQLLAPHRSAGSRAATCLR